MIRYSLVCEAQHGFESWFPSSDSYDDQVARGLVTCPVCDSAKVAKALMVPRVARTDRERSSADVPAPPDAPVTMIAEPERQVRAMLRALREHVVAHSEHVGARFPEEAERRRWQGKFYHRPAGGESWVDVALRLRTWLADLERAPAGQRLMVVGHDIVIALVRYVCEGLDEEQVLELARHTPLRNASLSRLVRADDGTWSTAEYDEVSHLTDAGLEVTEHEGERHVRT